MSHTVTVTRTTTTTTTSAIILNTGYLKTLPGLLKVAQVIIAGVCMGIMAYYRNRYYPSYLGPMEEQFFMCIATTVFVASMCLLISCIVSLSTASIISKTIYELIYHFFAFLLTLAASITLLVEVNGRSRNSYYHSAYFSAAILGLVLSLLYLISTVFAYRTYRGL